MNPINEPTASTLFDMSALTHTDKEVEQLKRHVKTGDYFAILATVLGFVEDSLGSAITKNEELKECEIRVIQNLKKELTYLNNHYDIAPKDGSTLT